MALKKNQMLPIKIVLKAFAGQMSNQMTTTYWIEYIFDMSKVTQHVAPNIATQHIIITNKTNNWLTKRDELKMRTTHNSQNVAFK